MSLRDKILNSSLPESVSVEIPEWDCTVYVGVMTGTQRDKFETQNSLDRSNIRARLATYTVRDAEGKLLFTESDIPLLGSKSSIALDRIWDVAMKANYISKKDIAALEKNSD